jgi:hypothetical protein
MKKDLLLSALLSLVSLAAGAIALILAEFGASVWLFVGLLAWLLTFGLPTLVSVLLLARFWPGPSFQAFVISAVLVSFLVQFAAVAGIRRGRAWRRRRVAA